MSAHDYIWALLAEKQNGTIAQSLTLVQAKLKTDTNTIESEFFT